MPAAARGRPQGSITKPWQDAVRKACMAIDKETRRRKLDLLAESAVKRGLEGDIGALKEIGDRLDGKVPQALTGEDGKGPVQVLHRVELFAVEPQR